MPARQRRADVPRPWRSRRSRHDASSPRCTLNTWKFEFPYSVLISGCEHFKETNLLKAYVFDLCSLQLSGGLNTYIFRVGKQVFQTCGYLGILK